MQVEGVMGSCLGIVIWLLEHKLMVVRALLKCSAFLCVQGGFYCVLGVSMCSLRCFGWLLWN